MKKIKFLVLILFSISCQKQLEIILPEFEQKPVVNCLFTPDTNFILNLSHSISINDSVKLNIENAKCYLFSNELLIDSLSYISDGFYKSNIKPEQGKYYELKVITPDFDEVSSMSYIPANLQIVNIEQENFSVSPPVYSSEPFENLPYNRLSFTFTDNANTDNYYELKIILKRFWVDIEGLYFENPLLYSYDEIIKNEDILDYEPNLFVFSDSLFNGQTKTIDFLYKPHWITWDGNVIYWYGEYRLYYKFRAISKQMYDYRKSLIKHLYNQQSDNFESFGDPVQMYSNIINGYGIFAGYSEVYDSIFVENSEYEF